MTEEIIPLKVWHPDSGETFKETMASDLDHVGHEVALGSIQPENFWREVARLKELKLRQLQKKLTQSQQDLRALQTKTGVAF